MTVRHLAAAVLALLVVSFASIGAAVGFMLISPAEYNSDQVARAAPAADGRTAGEIFDQQVWSRALDAPTIEVVAPHAEGAIHPPIDIDVRFTAALGASIDLSTLRIRYGVIGIDVTDRIRKAAKVTPSGIRAQGAELPAGRHSMSVEIADSYGRKNKQTFKFTVEN